MPAGLSGGERRRLSVGIGLVTDPQLISMDEPTTGLDSEAALNLMELLAGLAAKNRTVRPALWLTWHGQAHAASRHAHWMACTLRSGSTSSRLSGMTARRWSAPCTSPRATLDG